MVSAKKELEMTATALIDYASPMIEMEKLLKEIHILCLDKKFREADIKVLRCIVEGRLLSHSLKVMEEREPR